MGEHPLPHSDRPPAAWDPWIRLGFRFLVLYFALFAIRFLTWALLGGDLPWSKGLYLWVAANVFQVEIQFFTGESSDTTYDYVIIATHLALATAGAAAWSILGRRQTAYPLLFDAQWTMMRVFLSTALLLYGFSKIYAAQMPPPSIFKLATPLGNLSPMDLLWCFMGASPTYQIVAGWLEFIPGILLLFRRTQLLGALTAAGALLNVWLLNVCYGVCVKNMSLHLLLLACVIALPDASRLFSFLVLQRAIVPRNIEPPWRSLRLRRFLSWSRWTWICIVFGWVFVFTPYQLGYFQSPKPKVRKPAPLQGNGFLGRTWQVDGFRAEGNETLSLDPWRMVQLQGEQSILISSLAPAGKEPQFWVLQPKPEALRDGTLSLEGQMSVVVLSRQQVGELYHSQKEPNFPAPIGELHYRIDGPVSDPERAEFSGELLLDARPTKIQFRLVRPTYQPEDFRLVRSPFRWIYEYWY